MCNLLSSMEIFAPCDRQLQRAYYWYQRNSPTWKLSIVVTVIFSRAGILVDWKRFFISRTWNVIVILRNTDWSFDITQRQSITKSPGQTLIYISAEATVIVVARFPERFLCLRQSRTRALFGLNCIGAGREKWRCPIHGNEYVQVQGRVTFLQTLAVFPQPAPVWPCSSVGGAAVIKPECRRFNSHSGQSLSLSLRGPNSNSSGAKAHMVYMDRKLALHITL